MKSTIQGRLAHWSQRVGERLTDSLYETLLSQPDAIERRRSGADGGLWLAGLLALLVHSMALLLALGGCMLLTWSEPNFLSLILGLILLLMAWMARPQVAPFPDHVLEREAFPVLHKLAERIAGEIKAPIPWRLGHDADFNAYYTRAGWRGQPCVVLGAPLLAFLSPRARIALLAHELAHGANGDPMRSRFLHGAVQHLVQWSRAVRPMTWTAGAEASPAGPLGAVVALPFVLALLVMSQCLWSIAQAMHWLVQRQSQTAEYLADRLGASVSGTEAFVEMLEALYAGDTLDSAIRQRALTAPDAGLQDVVDEERAAWTLRDLTPLREKSLAERRRADSSHPPTALRVRLLKQGRVRPPMELLSDDEAASLDLEVNRILALQSRELINRKLDAAYA